MLQLALLTFVYPLWFATGLYSRNMLPVKASSVTYTYSHGMYFVWALLHWYPLMGWRAIPQTLASWLMIVLILNPRWQPAVLLGWAATDMIWIAVEWHSKIWDYALLLIAFLRSRADSRK